jgi:hypothetical protein
MTFMGLRARARVGRGRVSGGETSERNNNRSWVRESTKEDEVEDRREGNGRKAVYSSVSAGQCSAKLRHLYEIIRIVLPLHHALAN